MGRQGNVPSFPTLQSIHSYPALVSASTTLKTTSVCRYAYPHIRMCVSMHISESNLCWAVHLLHCKVKSIHNIPLTPTSPCRTRVAVTSSIFWSLDMYIFTYSQNVQIWLLPHLAPCMTYDTNSDVTQLLVLVAVLHLPS